MVSTTGPLLPIEGVCDDTCGPCPASPILIDLAGNGFALTDLANGVRFDLFPDGTKERLSWTAASSDDAWLVLDRDHNGIVDDGTEMFGNFTEQPPPREGTMRNGYAALAVYDANGDKVITAADPIFASLRLWHDANHHGVSEADELTAPSGNGIVGLGTDYRARRRIDGQGNVFRFSARVDRTASSTVGAISVDVFLITDALAELARDQGHISRYGTVMLSLVMPRVKRPLRSPDGGSAAEYTCGSGCDITGLEPPDKVCIGDKRPACARCWELACPPQWCKGARACKIITDTEGHVTHCESFLCPPECVVK